MAATTALRALYLLPAFGILVAASIPDLSKRFLAYGPRSHVPPSTTKGEDQTEKPRGSRQSETSIHQRLLDHLASYKISHGYFRHFYLLSVTASLFWAQQYYKDGLFFRAMAAYAPRQSTNAASPVLAWLLMLLQGLRRLYECYAFDTRSKSTMWIPHYLLGLFFYLITSVAVWIEGAVPLAKYGTTASAVGRLALRKASPVSLFVMASYYQHVAHKHLYQLRTASRADGSASKGSYAMPYHGFFRQTLTPHYFSECLIYVALAAVAAPGGTDGEIAGMVNKTLMAAVAFEVVNLGVTAAGTKKWYERRFGRAAVRGKARMVPFVW